MELKICHLYPDVMNLSCDRGNVLTMEKRLQWRGIDVVTVSSAMGDRPDTTCDLVFLGNGQPFTQPLLLEDLKLHKADWLKSVVEDGIPVLAVDGGYELLGNQCRMPDGEAFAGLGILDMETKYERNRLVGDYAFTCDEPEVTVVGFENHAGRTSLGSNVRPLGRVLSGHGNNGEDKTEGARYRNVFGTYAHGCLLPKNPVLCDYILLLALARKYGSAELQTLDDTLECNAHRYMENRLLGK